mgnify:FL=1|tara:strand:+ start:170 stop:436 length:267 start_codon:yes stop_codon:yes gene_type:complete
MAEHMLKKYIAKIEKTVYLVETIELIAETEREAEEMLDDLVSQGYDDYEVTEKEEQEEVIDHAYIESSEELGVSKFMELNGGQTLERD